MHTVSRLALAFLTLAVPAFAAAAAPANVTGIRATLDGNGVRVFWESAGENIVAYRVFYSHASILKQNGLYDDFDSVDGSQTTHLLQNIPPGPELFVSVLAVDRNGEESPFFMEEAHVLLGGNDAPPAISAPAASSSAPAGSGVLRLLSAEAISATGVLLTFSHPLAVSPNAPEEIITIEYGSGARLLVTRFEINATILLVHTTPQEQGAAYRVHVSNAITGLDAGNAAVALDPDQPPMLFLGSLDGTQPAPLPAQEVTSLRLRAEPSADGRFTVEATWVPPVRGEIQGYAISQLQGGAVADPKRIAADVATVRIPGVPAGTFGVRVQTVGSDGTLSDGISQTIDLVASLAPPAPQPSIPTPRVPPAAPLPQSGPTAWMAITLAGGIVGWNIVRRKRLTPA